MDTCGSGVVCIERPKRFSCGAKEVCEYQWGWEEKTTRRICDSRTKESRACIGWGCPAVTAGVVWVSQSGTVERCVGCDGFYKIRAGGIDTGIVYFLITNDIGDIFCTVSFYYVLVSVLMSSIVR